MIRMILLVRLTLALRLTEVWLTDEDRQKKKTVKRKTVVMVTRIT